MVMHILFIKFFFPFWKYFSRIVFEAMLIDFTWRCSCTVDDASMLLSKIVFAFIFEVEIATSFHFSFQPLLIDPLVKNIMGLGPHLKDPKELVFILHLIALLYSKGSDWRAFKLLGPTKAPDALLISSPSSFRFPTIQNYLSIALIV